MIKAAFSGRKTSWHILSNVMFISIIDMSAIEK